MESSHRLWYQSDDGGLELTSSKWLAYLKKYRNVPEEELIAARDNTFDEKSFECMAELLNRRLPTKKRDKCIARGGDDEMVDRGKATLNSSGDQTIYPFRRLNGPSFTSSEWNKYLKTTYPHVSEPELAEIRDSINHPKVYKMLFESMASSLNLCKEIEKRDGLPATLAIPLFMLLSVHVKPRGENKPFSVYGEITTHHRPVILSTDSLHKSRFDRDYLYKRQFEEVEKFGSDGGNLTLNGPSRSCRYEVVCYTLGSRKLSVKLYDETQRILAHGCVDLCYSQNEFEEFKESVVDIGELSLTFKYVSIPMAIFGRVEIVIFNKGVTEDEDLLEPGTINLCGKVVATCKNSFGNYETQEIVLFDKNADKNEYEKVVIGSRTNLLFPMRSWVAVPACSLLHLQFDLFEFQTNKRILKEDVDLQTHSSYGFSKKILAAEFFVTVCATWFDPSSLGGSKDADGSAQGESKDADASVQGESKDADGSAQRESKDADASVQGESKDADVSVQGESKDADGSAQGESKDADASVQGESKDADVSGQGESKDADDIAQGEYKDGGGDGVQISGILKSCATLQKSPAVEVFSVLICHKMSTALKIHGLLRFSFGLSWDDNDNDTKIDILKKDGEYLLSLPGRGNTIPVSDGPRLYQNLYPLSVICDLKDTLDKLSIKGYQNSDYDDHLFRNKQLCSIFRGDHGFAALHYAIFPLAVQATLKVRYTENGLEGVGVPVFGSFCAQYNDFNYSSKYEKKCYRIVLFKRSGNEDPVVGLDGLIPLSRRWMVVPSDSSLRFYVRFIIGGRKFRGEGNIAIGTGSMSLKLDGCEVKINLEWSEVK